MLEVIFIVCNLLTADCPEQHVPVAEPMTPYQCTMRAQEEIARYTRETWGDDPIQVVRFTCKPLRPRA